jgi:hypothetical protein
MCMGGLSVRQLRQRYRCEKRTTRRHINNRPDERAIIAEVGFQVLQGAFEEMAMCSAALKGPMGLSSVVVQI